MRPSLDAPPLCVAVGVKTPARAEKQVPGVVIARPARASEHDHVSGLCFQSAVCRRGKRLGPVSEECVGRAQIEDLAVGIARAVCRIDGCPDVGIVVYVDVRPVSHVHGGHFVVQVRSSSERLCDSMAIVEAQPERCFPLVPVAHEILGVRVGAESAYGDGGERNCCRQAADAAGCGNPRPRRPLSRCGLATVVPQRRPERVPGAADARRQAGGGDDCCAGRLAAPAGCNEVRRCRRRVAPARGGGAGSTFSPKSFCSQ